jgi:hypothetical protein
VAEGQPAARPALAQAQVPEQDHWLFPPFAILGRNALRPA